MEKKCRRIIFCTFLNTHKKASADEVAKPPMRNLAWAAESIVSHPSCRSCRESE